MDTYTVAAGRHLMDSIPAPALPPAGGTVLGWRVWRLQGGQLLGPFSSLSPIPGALRPWRPGVNEATCFDPGDHSAPAPGCECGIRGMPRKKHLLVTLTAAEGNADRALASLGVWGQVELSGTILGPSPNDPGGCLRASHAEIKRLILHPSRARAADMLADRLGVKVEIGEWRQQSPTRQRKPPRKKRQRPSR